MQNHDKATKLKGPYAYSCKFDIKTNVQVVQRVIVRWRSLGKREPSDAYLRSAFRGSYCRSTVVPMGMSVATVDVVNLRKQGEVRSTWAQYALLTV